MDKDNLKYSFFSLIPLLKLFDVLIEKPDLKECISTFVEKLVAFDGQRDSMLEIVKLGQEVLKSEGTCSSELCYVFNRIKNLVKTVEDRARSDFKLKMSTRQENVELSTVSLKRGYEANSSICTPDVKVIKRNSDSGFKTSSPSDEAEKKLMKAVAPSTQHPKHYQVVQSIGFGVIESNGCKKIRYKCFVSGCGFNLMEETAFIDHFTLLHAQNVWYHYCNACSIIVSPSDQNRITDEFNHLKDVHVKINPADINYKDLPNTEVQLWLNEENQKNKVAAMTMISDFHCLEAKFKCMEYFCTFSSPQVEVFKAHLAMHSKDSKAKGDKKCSYCNFTAEDIGKLIDHIEDIHKNDKYQCSQCFYRSVSETNAHNHMTIYHPCKVPSLIECQNQTTLDRFEVKNKLSTKKNLILNVAPLYCVICPETYFLLEDYHEHIRRHKNWKTITTTCKNCRKKTDLASIEEHFDSCYSIGLYQCLYCKFGTNLLKQIQLHMMNQHSSQVAVICQRSRDKLANPTRLSSLSVDFL